jgi:hypothetical protein
LIIRKLEMINKVYGIENHVHFVVWLTMLLPSVGKEWPCTGRLWQPGRNQDMNTLLHMGWRRRAWKHGSRRAIAPIATGVDIKKPHAGHSIQSWV